MQTLFHLRAFFSGRVQGVGFRAYVAGIARGYSVTGWVKNLRDGRVELVACGDNQELNEFVAAIREGEMAAHIHDVAEHIQQGDGGVANCTGFEIK